MSYQTNHLPFIFLLLASLLASVKGQAVQPPRINCLNDNGNYTSNSTYQANLRILLSNLSARIDITGFYNASVGQNPNRANGIALCRADVQLDDCRSCIQNATVQLLEACPNQRDAVLYQEFCTLRYSNVSFVGTMDTRPVSFWWNVRNSTRLEEFMSDVGALLFNISNQASNGGPLRKVAYRSAPSVGFQTIYALEQCTPDLSAQDCLSCLNSAIQEIPRQHFYGSIGARVLQPSCILRYEVREFYNETRLRELQPMAPPPAAPLAPPPVASSPPPTGNGNNSDNTNLIIIIVVPILGIVILIMIGFLIWRKNQKKPKGKIGTVEGGDDVSIIESLQYDFSMIQTATNHFSEANKLGQGGLGAVFKGKLPNGQEIAVKRLSGESGQGDLEFKNEVLLLAKLQHRNLVRLLGFSLQVQGQEKLLVYEFVQNASLDQFLFDPARSSLLDWNARYKIIAGIARGVLYLHEDSRVSIIHRDLKASNVLLDGDMHPKIADFGMARLFSPEETQDATSRIVGTYGYMAPEYALRGQFSIKSDVFSVGVILLEIISGLKNNCSRNGEAGEDLISSAWRNWRDGTSSDLVDPVLRVGTGIPRDILRCIHIGLLCVQESALQRPTMASTVTMLNSNSITLPVPSAPAFCFNGGYNSESSLIHEFNSREGNSRRPTRGDRSGDSISQNEMSFSEFKAR